MTNDTMLRDDKVLQCIVIQWTQGTFFMDHPIWNNSWFSNCANARKNCNTIQIRDDAYAFRQGKGYQKLDVTNSSQAT